jgi:lipoprotein NlpI
VIVNSLQRIFILTLLSPMLAACATTFETTVDTKNEVMLAPGEVRIEQDAEYVTLVEHIARRRGIQVEWVNPPSKRVKGE